MVLRTALCISTIAALCVAQQPTTPQAPPAASPAQAPSPNAIVANVSEVIVPVTVTDDKGRFVSNLDQKDFQIFDQGREQVIKSFSRERNQPVVVGFLIDLSNGSRTQWKHWVVAAEGMVETMLDDKRTPEQKKRFGGYL